MAPPTGGQGGSHTAACPPARACPVSAATCLSFQQERRDSHIFATLFKNGYVIAIQGVTFAAERVL